MDVSQVTIDDCTHVVDAGRVREMRYDPITRMSCLVEVWISKVGASGEMRWGGGRGARGRGYRVCVCARRESGFFGRMVQSSIDREAHVHSFGQLLRSGE